MKSPAIRKHPFSLISVFALFALMALIAACGSTGNTVSSNAGAKHSTQPKSQVTATAQPNGHVTPIATTQPSSQSTGNSPASQPNNTTPVAGPQEGSPNACSGTSGLSTIHMLNTTQGWASNQIAVFTTSDGGHTWKCVTPAGMQTQTGVIGDFMDASHAWITPDLSVSGNTISIWRTSDGGQSWQSSTISANEPQVGDAPHFVNTQDGWLEVITNGGPGAGSESAEIFQTTDGGQTWNVVADTTNPASGLPNGGLKTGISFKDTLNGWATGTDASNTPWLYVTHDGGKTWQKQGLPDLPGAIGTAATAVSYQTTPPVFFGNTGLLPVFVTGQLAQNQPVNGFLLYHTTNGGQSWYTDWKSNPGTLTSFATNQNDLYIADPLHAWAGAANSNAIYETSNGGESWQELGTHFGPASDISFVNASDGWAFLSNVGPVSTTDGGVDWKILMYNYA